MERRSYYVHVVCRASRPSRRGTSLNVPSCRASVDRARPPPKSSSHRAALPRGRRYHGVLAASRPDRDHSGRRAERRVGAPGGPREPDRRPEGAGREARPAAVDAQGGHRRGHGGAAVGHRRPRGGPGEGRADQAIDQGRAGRARAPRGRGRVARPGARSTPAGGGAEAGAAPGPA